MKTKIIFLLFLAPVFCVYAEYVRSYDFEPGKYRMLDYPVNIRSQPNLNGSVIGKLGLNDEIEVIENMGNEQQIESVWQYWYKIKSNNIEGFIWGGYIAVKYFIYDIDNNGVEDFFYFRYSYVDRLYNTNPANKVDYWDCEVILPHDIFMYINNRRISNNKLEERFREYHINVKIHSSMLAYWDDFRFYEEKGRFKISIFGLGATEEYFEISKDGNIEFLEAWGP
jgi:hypothetical protein